jgi:hypothetical protein
MPVTRAGRIGRADYAGLLVRRCDCLTNRIRLISRPEKVARKGTQDRTLSLSLLPSRRIYRTFIFLEEGGSTHLLRLLLPSAL